MSREEVTAKLTAGVVAHLGLNEVVLPLLVLLEGKGIPVACELDCPPLAERFLHAEVDGGGGIVEQVALDGPLLCMERVV